MKVQILTIGNEILSGHTLDTNANFLAKKLTQHGLLVQRIVSVPDNSSDIARELMFAIEENFEVLLITGGLGPTYDDGTAVALAKALNLPLQEHPQALEMVKKRYLELFEEGLLDDSKGTPSRNKMAMLPSGTIPLSNKVGTAPGIYLTVKTSISEMKIFSLPGVPAEMKSIFAESVLQHLGSSSEYYCQSRRILSIRGESVLAPLLDKVRANYPAVYIKSTAGSHWEKGIPVIFSGLFSSKDIGNEEIDKASSELEFLVMEWNKNLKN